MSESGRGASYVLCEKREECLLKTGLHTGFKHFWPVLTKFQLSLLVCTKPVDSVFREL